MYRYKNIAVTGQKGAGKSTLSAWLLERLGKPFAGFQTFPYDRTPVGPLYELTEILTGDRAPISRLQDGSIRGIPESFDTFGAACLRRAAASDTQVVLLDEIGRFERYSLHFLAEITAILDSKKIVIAVLKKEDLPHIQSIKERPDTLALDLDILGRKQARQMLETWLEH